MRLDPRSWLLLAALVAVPLTAAPARAQPLDTARLRAALEAEAAHAAPLAAFYRRHPAGAWTAPGGLTERGRALVEALAGLADDGLDPATYRVAAAAAPLGPARERVEVALSRALLAAASDLRRGRVEPARLYHDWRAERPALDGGAVLDAALGHGPAHALAEARPPHAGYAQTRAALARYRAYAEAGGWPALSDGPALREGDAGPAVVALRARLAASGDLARGESTGSAFNAALGRAVRAAQARHGLAADGVVGPATRAALNVPAEARARQLALALERWRWVSRELGATYVLVNAASVTVALVEGGAVALALRGIVGTAATPTPAFESVITYAEVNPYWLVPTSIARGEIFPRVRRDPGYLARHHMTVLPGGQLRQAPGPDNPLGPVKFIFENPFGVRLHGTSAPALFDRARRTFSHGCIRVERPLELAERLLRGAGWDAARFEAALARDVPTRVPLQAPVPIVVGYWTAWAEADGTVHFREDVYGRDGPLERALAPGVSARFPTSQSPVVASQETAPVLGSAPDLASAEACG